MCENTGCSNDGKPDALIPEGCYTPEGEPVKCRCCGSTNITSKVEAVLDFYAGMGPTCEESYACGDCNAPLAYWAYGSFDPSYLAAISAGENAT